MFKVLLVDDSNEIHELTRNALEAHHYLSTVSTLSQAQQLLHAHHFDLVILDLNLPDGDGMSLLSFLQSSADKQPPAVVICSTRNTLEDRVLGFQLGTDDYIPKPINVREYKVRIEAKLRKLRQQEKNIFTDTIEIAPSSQRVFLKSPPDPVTQSPQRTEIFLTPSEYRLLLALVQNKNRVLNRDQLIDSMWGTQKIISDRTIDSYIVSLRKKLGVHGKPIRTIYGNGYIYESNGSS